MLTSLSQLLIVSVFILPGYLLRVLAGRKVPLSRVGDSEVVLQSLLLSMVLLTATLGGWLLVGLFFHIQVTSVVADALTGRIEQTETLTVLFLALTVYALAVIITVIPNLAEFVLTRSITRTFPMFYSLFNVEAARISRGQDVIVWARVILSNGTIISGRVVMNGNNTPDNGSLVLMHATKLDPQVSPYRHEDYLFIPAASIVYVLISYNNKYGEAYQLYPDAPASP